MTHLTAAALIPAHNEAATIGGLVRACLDSYPLHEVVVVADSCTDNTADVARQAGARVIVTSHGDKAANQNEALPTITADVIIGFDGDTVPDQHCIARMMADIEGGLDATCATILPLQGTDVGAANGHPTDVFVIRGRRFSYALGRRWWRLAQAAVGRMQVLTGAAYAFRTNVIRDVGGFPRGLISADMDATWAMHAKHYKLGYTPRAIAYTLEPDSFRVYRAQMRRWSAGYFQNMAKYWRQAITPRSLLVVGTALFDLVSLFWAYALLGIAIASGHGWWLLRTYAFWVLIHFAVVFGLVASVVGIRHAARGAIPYQVLNLYNKWIYITTMFREWILGKHWASWTGRQGRGTEITKMSQSRKVGLAATAMTAASAVAAARLHHPQPLLALPSAAILAVWAHGLYQRDGHPLRRHLAAAAGDTIPMPTVRRRPRWTTGPAMPFAAASILVAGVLGVAVTVVQTPTKVTPQVIIAAAPPAPKLDVPIGPKPATTTAPPPPPPAPTRRHTVTTRSRHTAPAAPHATAPAAPPPARPAQQATTPATRPTRTPSPTATTPAPTTTAVDEETPDPTATPSAPVDPLLE